MSNREFTATRTMLANAMATAGAELLEYMGVGGALAAIPNTEPQQYVVAGTLAMIGKLLPAPAAQAPVQNAEEVRRAVLEEAALAAEKVADDYSERQGGKWPELRDDAETGARDCVAAIRSLATKEAAAAVAPKTPEVPLWDENGEPWNLAAEQVEYERAQQSAQGEKGGEA